MSVTKIKKVGNNFDPYLVGLQFTSDGGTPLFTIGNFQITTNITPPPKRSFQLGAFSAPLTIENLGSTTLNEANQFINDNLSIYLNLNNENLLSHVLFGSFVKFIDATINQIFENWPGSIYCYRIVGTATVNTLTNYAYDPVTDTATFNAPVNCFYNYFNLNYSQNASTFPNTSIPNSLKNLTVFYNQYEIFINNTPYPITNFVGSPTLNTGSCQITVKGNPFPAAVGPGTSTLSYHIKPIEVYVERFFSSLDDFSRFLLNRNTTPIYTCNIYYEQENEDFFTLQKVRRFTWPVTDGYNLDRFTPDFLLYRQDLLDIAQNYDDYRTDLMRRVLVTESISYFELNPTASPYYPLNTTEKIDQLLTIYGREFDEVKKYIDGVSFANVVSYNRQGNTPDALIKDFAYYLGWDLLSPMDENQLLSNFIPTQSTYPGMTVGYTPAEAEIEFWRRLVLNSAFLFKSKGTRKPIEFLFDFINTPPSLVNFTEYIYQAKQKLDINLFKQIIGYLYDSTDISSFNIDEDGYPKVPVDTLTNYFQKGGGWYRETAGINSQIDYYEGNNPHLGPYDGGQYYIDKFKCLLEGFTGQTVKITEEHVEFTNLFANYFKGTVDGYQGDVYVDAIDLLNRPTDCIIITGSVVNNPSNINGYTVCGCPIPSAITQAILVSVKRNLYSAPVCSAGTIFNTAAILAALIPCSDCEPTGTDNKEKLILFDCDSAGPPNQVPLDCCLEASSQYDFTWIEENNTGRGFCYYDDPCPNSGFEYIGNFSWRRISNGIITNQVPKKCCLYRGGIYSEVNGRCTAPQ